MVAAPTLGAGGSYVAAARRGAKRPEPLAPVSDEALELSLELQRRVIILEREAAKMEKKLAAERKACAELTRERDEARRERGTPQQELYRLIVEAKAEGEVEAERKVEELRENCEVLRAESMGRGWQLVGRAAALRDTGAGVQRVGMVRPLAVWKRLTGRLARKASRELDKLKAELEIVRRELEAASDANE